MSIAEVPPPTASNRCEQPDQPAAVDEARPDELETPARYSCTCSLRQFRTRTGLLVVAPGLRASSSERPMSVRSSRERPGLIWNRTPRSTDEEQREPREVTLLHRSPAWVASGRMRPGRVPSIR